MAEFRLIEATERFVHIALAGRLDIAGINEVELRFTFESTARRLPVVLDISGVELMTSYGMGLLISSARTLLSHGKKLVLVAPPEHIERALRGAGIDRAVEIAPSVDEAKRLLGVA